MLGWLHQTWRELPDIYQRGPNAIRDKGTARRIVEILEDHGWLVSVESGGEVAGLHRRDVWQITGRPGA